MKRICNARESKNVDEIIGRGGESKIKRKIYYAQNQTQNTNKYKLENIFIFTWILLIP